MRALYIVGIVLSFIFLFVIAFFIEEVESARFMSFYDYSDPYSSYNYNSYYDTGSDETMMAAIVSFLFLVLFIFAGIL